MNLYEATVIVFNGRYTQREHTRVQASDWSAAAGKAIRQAMAERQKRGLGGKRLERIDLQLIRVPGRRAT